MFGVASVEIIAPEEAGARLGSHLDRTGGGRLRLLGWQALNMRRIEAGVPWPVSELNQDVVPAETLQLDRAVDFRKGCYLGQEIVERMRTRGGAARQLVGFAFQAGTVVSCPATVELGGRHVGTVTSFCEPPGLGHGIGLGYLRTAHCVAGTRVTAEGQTAQVHALPF
jgi:folate-binding protein YgfZ